MVGLPSSRSDTLDPSIQAAFERSREPRREEGIEKLAERQDAIRRATRGETLLSIAAGTGSSFLVITNERTLLIDDAVEGPSNAHGEVYEVDVTTNGSGIVVAVVTEREHAGTDGVGSDPSAPPGIRFAVGSSLVADTVRDTIQERVTEARWPLPTLFPGFYHDVLDGLGRPRTEQNVLALVEYLAQMFSVHALAWLDDQTEIEQEWWARFHDSRVPDERWPYLLDDMLAFFWHRDWRYRRTVSEFPVDARIEVLGPDSPVRKYGNDLPFGIGSHA